MCVCVHVMCVCMCECVYVCMCVCDVCVTTVTVAGSPDVKVLFSQGVPPVLCLSVSCLDALLCPTRQPEEGRDEEDV